MGLDPHADAAAGRYVLEARASRAESNVEPSGGAGPRAADATLEQYQPLTSSSFDRAESGCRTKTEVLPAASLEPQLLVELHQSGSSVDSRQRAVVAIMPAEPLREAVVAPSHEDPFAGPESPHALYRLRPCSLSAKHPMIESETPEIGPPICDSLGVGRQNNSGVNRRAEAPALLAE